MRLILISSVAVFGLMACQTTTNPVQTQEVKPEVVTACTSSQKSEIAALEKRIAELKAATARGFQPSTQVVRVVSPIPTCKSVAPFLNICLPLPADTRPLLGEYNKMKTEQKSLEARRAKLPNCG